MKKACAALFLLSLSPLMGCNPLDGGDESPTPEATPDPSPTQHPTAAEETPSETESTPTAASTPTSESTPAATPTASDAFWPSATCQNLDDDRPLTWTETSHAKGIDPDYDRLFDTSKVHRIDITMAPETQAAMHAELTELLGEFGVSSGGNGGGNGGGIPDDIETLAIEACADLEAGDSCTITSGDFSVTSTCGYNPSGTLYCQEPQNGGGPPTDGGPPDDGGNTDLVEEDPSYFPVEVAFDGQSWCYVGMRYKGNSTLKLAWSQGNLKLPFRFNFDKFEDDYPEVDNQRFWGFKEMTFGSNFGDTSLLRDILAGEIFEDRGVPSAQGAFYQVYVDAGEGPIYWGLYSMIEDPSDEMMDQVYGDNDGNLYKPDGTCATFTCFDEADFEKKSNEDEADFSDIQNTIDALYAENDDAAAWRAGLEAHFNVDAFLKWLAINSTIENWDTYGQMSHNFYLYARPDDGGRLTILPWDLNESLKESRQFTSSLLHEEADESWPLIRFLLDDPVYNERYRAELEAATGGAFAIETFTARATQLHTMIEAYVVGEKGEIEGYGYTNPDAFNTALDDLITHVESRHEAVEAVITTP